MATICRSTSVENQHIIKVNTVRCNTRACDKGTDYIQQQTKFTVNKDTVLLQGGAEKKRNTTALHKYLLNCGCIQVNPED